MTHNVPYNPCSQMDQYCWCKFDYTEYGLTKEQVKTINEIMIEQASTHLKYEEIEGCISRDAVYLKLLEGFDYI